mmetsp:Transcript_4456/g.13003  ORF Transcript_4456/g.13003 Transcript_4456/m.13003 type:complete len:223 (-) Transcript_4456:2538-3206(-)
MAWTHMHMASHATDTLAMTSGEKVSLSSQIGSITLTVDSLIASLSKSTSLVLSLSGPRSLSIFWLRPHQSSTFWPVSGSVVLPGFISNMMQTAFRTSLTPAGGFLRALISTIWSFLSLDKDLTASSSAGSAAARPSSAEALMASHSAAFADAADAAASDSTCTVAASSLSAAICTCCCSTSTFVRSRMGWFASSCCCSVATCSLVEASFSKPMTRRLRCSLR